MGSLARAPVVLRDCQKLGVALHARRRGAAWRYEAPRLIKIEEPIQ